jgi:predicted Zn-dependent protease
LERRASAKLSTAAAGTLNADDEGLATQETLLIEGVVLKGYL